MNPRILRMSVVALVALSAAACSSTGGTSEVRMAETSAPAQER